jgi:hypothetical protein
MQAHDTAKPRRQPREPQAPRKHDSWSSRASSILKAKAQVYKYLKLFKRKI